MTFKFLHSPRTEEFKFPTSSAPVCIRGIDLRFLTCRWMPYVVQTLAWWIQYSGPVTVLKWRDKRNVTMVSTYHSADTKRVSDKGKETEKPLYVIDYNHKMGGVDLNKLLHMYIVERKKKNDQMVPETFQKAAELYSSQFVCCLLTSDRKKYTAALV